METEDILALLKNKIWVSCHPVKKKINVYNKQKWEMAIYEKQGARWLKRKRKLFNHPASAYEWAQQYLIENVLTLSE